MGDWKNLSQHQKIISPKKRKYNQALSTCLDQFTDEILRGPRMEKVCYVMKLKLVLIATLVLSSLNAFSQTALERILKAIVKSKFLAASLS
jgi:hypothetical protein